MENKDYQKNSGCCGGVMFIGLLGIISFASAGQYMGVALFTALEVFAAIMLYIAREDYKVYKSFKRRLQSKSVRDQLIYILRHAEGENAYLHYGTPEEFKKFREYVSTLSASDDFFDDFNDFLDKAEKHNRLK